MALQRDDAPWYKQRWPWFLMAGPAIVVVAGFVTLWYAINSPNDLVTDDYYKEGMAINQRLQRDHQVRSLGLHADVMRSDRNLRLMLSATSQVELPAAIVLRLDHPTLANLDQRVEMIAEGAGFYDGKLSADIVGKWLVTIEDPAGQWRLHGKWQADSEEPLRLQAAAEK
ncbi:MAG: FixH family protein [Azonexus sp.]|uniref:FixH family protein n=1 Tax=Azonexus sp. TaxID=1872668 RepID=UPI00282EC848|nr:FixH family protein [Azonexus sp.]MDR0777777.1 FixH family protein [Azonexus sp.]